MTPGLRYCVVIPMLDEEANAERCVQAVLSAVRATTPAGSLLVVDDGSSDATPRILGARPPAPDFHVVRHDRNRGYGAALRTGTLAARELGFDYVLFMDADLTTDPSYIPAFVEQMRLGRDVIKATRYAGSGGMRGVPAYRALISRTGNALARRLFGLPLTDVTNGFRAVRVPLLAALELRETGFTVIMEELFRLKASARTYAEVPYVLTSRGPGQGVSRFVYRPRTFAQYLKYALLSLAQRSPAPSANGG